MAQVKHPLPRFEVVKSKKNKEWFWRFLAKNGKEICRSSETYKRRRSANFSAESMNAFDNVQVITLWNESR